MNPLDFLINSAKKIVDTGKSAVSSMFSFKPLESFKPEPKVMDFSRGEGLSGTQKMKALEPILPAFGGQTTAIKLPFSNKIITKQGAAGPETFINEAVRSVVETPERWVQTVADFKNTVQGKELSQKGVLSSGRVQTGLADAKDLYKQAISNGMNQTQALVGATLYGVGATLVDLTSATDILTKGVLKATKFDPVLDRSLTRLNLNRNNFSMENLTRNAQNSMRNAMKSRNVQAMYDIVDDTANILGSLQKGGVPNLSKPTQILQDLSKQVQGFGTYSPYNMIGSEIPLPGYRATPGQAPAFGLSTRKVEPVGFGSSGKDVLARSEQKVVLPQEKPPALSQSISQAKASGQSFDEWVKGQGGIKSIEKFKTADELTSSIIKEPLEAGIDRKNLTSAYKIGDTNSYILAKKTGKTVDERVSIVDNSGKEISSSINKVPEIEYRIAQFDENIDSNLYNAYLRAKTGYTKLDDVQKKLVDDFKTRSQLKAEWDKATAETPVTKPIPKQEITQPIKEVSPIVSLTKNITKENTKSTIQKAKDYWKSIPNKQGGFVRPFGGLSQVDRLIAEGKIRVVSRDGRDVYQYKKAGEWVNARDEDSAIKQVTPQEKAPKKTVEYPPEIENAKMALEVRKEALENSRFANADLRFMTDKEGRIRELGDTKGKLSNKIENMMREADVEDAREYTEGVENYKKQQADIKLAEQAVKDMEKNYIAERNRAVVAQKQLDKEILDNAKKAKEAETQARKAEKMKLVEEGIANAKAQEAAKQIALTNIKTAKETPIVNLTRWQKIVSQPLNPLRFVDTKTKEIFETWHKRNLASRVRANKEAQLFADIPKKEGMDTILKYQAGEPTPYSAKIKEIFDSLYQEGKKSLPDLPYRQNYLPQVWKGSPQEIRTKIEQYLREKGMTQEQITAYENGEKLSDEVVKVLKVNPFFDERRVFQTYAEGMQYGLEPKYTHPAELVGTYVEEIDRVITNKGLVDKLIKEGKILPFEDAPMTWDMLNLPFHQKGYMAPPNTAKLINGLFGKEGGELWGYTAGASKTMQQIKLSAGLPYTTVNFFALSQLNKELHTGNYKAISAFFRANFDGKTVKWMNENRGTIYQMARQGIDLRNTADSWGNLHTSLKDADGLIGKGKHIFDEVFEKKTFQAFMPMMQIQLFKDVYNGGLKKGLTPLQAEELAGRTISNNFGLTGFLGRSQKTSNVLSTFFFAPIFRESIIRTLANTGKTGIDLVTSIGGYRTPRKPSMSRNRRLLAGMITSYFAYNMLNKALNDGDDLWDNPPNRQFALRIPLDNGDVIYIEWMFGFTALPRALFHGTYNLLTGDFEGAGQKYGTMFSMPIKMVSEVASNRDYWGNPIYLDTDTGPIKAAKLARHASVSVNHPFIEETIKTLYEDKPAYQSILTALEMPMKFSSEERENMSQLYREREKMSKETANKNRKLDKLYQKETDLLLDGTDEEIDEFYMNLTDEEDKDLKEYVKKQESLNKKAETNQLKANMLKVYDKMDKMIRDKDDAGVDKLLMNLTDEEDKMLRKIEAEKKNEKTTTQFLTDYIKAYTTDPANALRASFTKEVLGKVEGNLVELQRFYGLDYWEAGGSQEKKKELMTKMGLDWNTEQGNYKLEHITPVKAGGSSADSNLLPVTNAEHDSYTPVDIAVIEAVKLRKITRREATKIMTTFKIDKTLKAEDIPKLLE
jgi:hypothetical protein